MGAGSLLFSLPHFISGRYLVGDDLSHDLAGEGKGRNKKVCSVRAINKTFFPSVLCIEHMFVNRFYQKSIVRPIF